MKLPEFQTPRLILKEVTLEDIPSYEKNFIDYEIVRHLSASVPWPYPPNGIRDFLQKIVFPILGTERWLWGIFLKPDRSELIGVVDLWRKGTPDNRGFWLARNHWGKGFMTEAVVPVMDYAFKELGFEKVVLANALGNKASRRVKEKTGARLVDVRPAKFVDPSYTLHEIWELSKEDWEMFRGK
jgi:[ribosomal protein S5]-alanine N-acetyltransferase